jgi:hypothetical protein
MVRGALTVIVGMASALVLTACGSGSNNSTPGLPTDITSETDTPITDEPFITDTPTTEEDTTEPPAAPTTMAAGERTTISASDGSFDVVVGKPRGRATQPLTSNRWLGLPVTISGVTGRPIVSETNFGISPVASMGSDTGDVDAAFDLDSGSAGKTACAGMKSFSDVMDESNAEADPVSGYVLGSNFGTATFCLLFLYDASDHPTTVGYYSDMYSSDSVPHPDALWKLGAQPKALTAPTGIVYAVRADGGISSVTYSTKNFSQEQDTDVSGNTWTKTVPNEGISIAVLEAQSAGSGTISCTITIDGERVAHQSSQGAYAVVTCSANN